MIGESCKMFCIIWEDKKSVILLSIHAMLRGFLCITIETVLRRNRGVQDDIMTSWPHLEYTTRMRRVDVADQLRASYSTQNYSYKWWHYIFFFLLDMTVVNIFFIYVGRCKKAHLLQKPMTHL